jgi:cytochrome oxidase Cu insertion factor (SCO1/SenC/PrrC family)
MLKASPRLPGAFYQGGSMRSGILVTVLAALALGQPAAGPKTHLKPGDEAPDFRLRTTDGKEFHLASHRGKTVVVAFFPAAFTGG